MRRSIWIVIALAVLIGSQSTLPANAGPPASRAVAAAQTSSGVDWTPVAGLDSEKGGFASVSCVSRTFCLAGGRHGGVFKWNGSHWNRQPKLARSAALRHLACASPTFCTATLENYQTRRRDHYWSAGRFRGYRTAEFDGRQWHVSRRSYPRQRVQGLDCVSRRFCMAVVVGVGGSGGDGYLVWRGTSWTRPAELPGVRGRNSGELRLGCLTPRKCFAAEGPPAAKPRLMRWSGTRWRSVPSRRPTDLAGMSCPGNGFCLGVRPDGVAVRYRHGRWRTGPRLRLPAQVVVRGVVCASSSFCLAQTNGRKMYPFRDGRWRGATDTGLPASTAVSCADRRFCAVTDAAGHVVMRRNGAWRRPKLVAPLFGGPALASCASTSACEVIDNEGGAVRFDGTRWFGPARIPNGRGPVALSCREPSSCMAVSDGGASTYNGSWAPFRPPATLIAVGCLSLPYCVALSGPAWYLLDARTGEYLDSGSVESRPESISCAPGANTCLVWARDGGYWVFRNGGLSIRSEIPGLEGRLRDVSCGSARHCVALTSDGEVFTWDGDSWAGPTRVSDTDNLYVVSCASATFCEAAGEGVSSTYDDGTWSPTAPIAGVSHRTRIGSISCAEGTGDAPNRLCVAVAWRSGKVLVGH